MKRAIQEAQAAIKGGDLPFGAVVVQNNKLISTGQSREKRDGSVTAHGEMEAIDKACKKLGLNLGQCVIYASGEPCNMCAAAIFQSKISRVVIGAERKDLPQIFRKRRIGIKDMADDSGYPIKIETGVLRQESIRLFGDVNLR